MSAVVAYGNDGSWMEALVDSVTIPDAAGVTTSSARNITRPGICIGYAITILSSATNDNKQAIGTVTVLEQGGSAIQIGEFVSGIRTQIEKQAGTAGATIVSVQINLWLRPRGSS